MIIYFYLTIIIVCSIITGIITTIIEKKGFYAQDNVIGENESELQQEIIVNKKSELTIAIPVIEPDPEYTAYNDDEPILLDGVELL